MSTPCQKEAVARIRAFSVLLNVSMIFDFGIEPERFRLEWISASEADKYARVSLEMERQIRELGPLRLNG